MKNRAKEFVNVLDLLQENISIRDDVLKFCPGLSKIDCFLLHFLYTTKEQVMLNELATILNVSYSRVTRIMDKLCNLNLAQRTQSEDDRRCHYASLTPEGEAKVKEVKELLVDHQISVLELIPEERLDDLLELLTVYTNAFAKATKK